MLWWMFPFYILTVCEKIVLFFQKWDKHYLSHPIVRTILLKFYLACFCIIFQSNHRCHSCVIVIVWRQPCMWRDIYSAVLICGIYIVSCIEYWAKLPAWLLLRACLQVVARINLFWLRKKLNISSAFDFSSLALSQVVGGSRHAL